MQKNHTVTDLIVLDQIFFDIEPASMLEKLHVKEKSSHASTIEQLIRRAQEIGKPKAIYKLAFVESYKDHSVIVDGTTLTSRVLRVNLDQTHRVFPYIATCGNELEEWSQSFSDALLRFWVDEIKEMALRLAIQSLVTDIKERYQPGTLSSMNPGSLEDWPLSAQPALFDLLGNPEESTGVRLTPSLLMTPVKSVSGIYFPSEQSFASCQLCPRENCPSRKAPYNERLYAKKFARKT